MFNTRINLLVLSIFTYFLIQIPSSIQSPAFDDETGCPLNVQHVCDICAQDQNRLGCYCELDSGDEIITASILTPCPIENFDPCLNHSCKNGAACVPNGLTNYKCNCTAGFGGEFCNHTLPKCADPEVQCPYGECVDTADPRSPVYCQCYDGTRRDPLMNATCPLSPCYKDNGIEPVCENNGTCRVFNNAHICECTEGFAGQNCTKKLRTPLCGQFPNVCGEGKCQQSLTPPYYTCNCGNHPSTFGKNISDLTKCEESGCYANNPCQNGGTCSNKGKGAFLCQCSSRFTGSKCEKQSVCYNNPCLNKGVCEAVNSTVFFCNCPPYYTGQRCEIRIVDPCVGKNCGPFGVCRDIRGSAVCQCSDGFHFDNAPCQHPCVNKTCTPGACTPKKNATYEAVCACPVYRKGDSCELPNDICRKTPPCGGGYCKPNYASARGYSCVCEGGVVKTEPCPFSKVCPIKDCGTQGVCVETDGIIVPPGNRPIYYVCSCKNGYISSGKCDDVLGPQMATAKSRCGPEGEPYPSRNPNNPFGCWCKNGTHVPEIEEDGPQEYCV